MLKPLLISSLAILSVGFASHARADINDALTNICAIVEADDKHELRKKIKNVRDDYNAKLHMYYSGIKCSGNSLIRVAVLNNSLEAGTLLVKKMPKKHLENPEDDGKTLMAWITEQGLEQTPIAQVVRERI